MFKLRSMWKKPQRICLLWTCLLVISICLEFHMITHNNHEMVMLAERSFPNEISSINRTEIRSAARFIRDEFCGECRTIITNKKKPHQTCGSIIYSTAQRKNVSLIEAARIEVELFNHTECLPCLPESCEESDKKLWRYDEKYPPILYAQAHYLSDIPKQHRLPSDHLPSANNNFTFEAITKYLSSASNSYPRRQYFFEYNPSIISLPKQQIPVIPGERPAYLAAYRVSTQQGCLPPNTTLALIGGSWEDRGLRITNYVGLALLRHDLSVIQNGVFDLPISFQAWEDFRLFVIREQIYIATYCIITPLWIKAPEDMGGKTVLKPHFSSSMKFTVRIQPTICSQEDISTAKNLNYFVDQDNKTLVEMQPANPHIVYEINLDSTSIDTAPKVKEHAKINEYMPARSFYTREQSDLAIKKQFFGSPFTNDRGGACCMQLTDPKNGKKLLLGISHVKTPYRRKKLEGIVTGNHYLTRFYAFEARAPYSIVALSGFFCLPAQPGGSHSGKIHPLLGVPVWNQLEIVGIRYQCPAIHFVMGMTEKINDPSRVIISYGVSDCLSWFIEIEKASIMKLLFPSKYTN